MRKLLRSLSAFGLVTMLSLGSFQVPAAQAQSQPQSPTVLASIERTSVNIDRIPETKKVKKARKKLEKAERWAAKLRADLATVEQKFQNGEISQSEYEKQLAKLQKRIANADKKVQIKEAKLQLAEAKAVEKAAKKELKQAQKAFNKGQITQADLDAKQQAFNKANEGVQFAKQNVINTQNQQPTFSPSA